MNLSLRETLSHFGSSMGLERMIIPSILFHLVILALIVLGPLLPFKGQTFPSFYMVNLVSPPQRQPLEIKKSWVTKEIRRTEPIRKSKLKPLKKAATNVPMKQISKQISKEEILSKKISKKKTVKNTINRVEEEEESKKIKEAISRIKGEISQQKDNRSFISKEKVGIISSETADLQFKIYYTIIWGKIKEGWILPEGLMGNREDLEAIMTFRVAKNGKIEDIQFEKTSGNLYFDRSVLRAVEKADPLPPIPGEYKEDYLDVGVRFHPSDV